MEGALEGEVGAAAKVGERLECCILLTQVSNDNAEDGQIMGGEAYDLSEVQLTDIQTVKVTIYHQFCSWKPHS